jgi:hypothetical protein
MMVVMSAPLPVDEIIRAAANFACITKTVSIYHGFRVAALDSADPFIISLRAARASQIAARHEFIMHT